jgi:hypothetical protein
MAANEAYELNQQITLFITTFAGEIQDLRRSIAYLEHKPTHDCLNHYGEIISYLLEVMDMLFARIL